MINIINLSKKYENQDVIKNLNVEFKKNKLIFITGRSGCGKSTLLNIIGGLEKCDSGEILIDNNEVDFANKNEEIKIDYVFQNFNLIGNLSGLQNILISNQIVNREVNESDIYDIAKVLNISKKTLNKKVSKLSGGEKQRIAILRSLSRGSDILLCDEPTGNLDYKNSDEIFNLLSKLKDFKTIIVVSHDLESAKKYGDYILDMETKTMLENKLPSVDKKPVINVNGHKTKFSKYKPIIYLTWSDFKRKWLLFLLVLLTFVTTCISTSTAINLTQKSFNINSSYKNQIEQNIYEIETKHYSSYITRYELKHIADKGFDYISENYITPIPYYYTNSEKIFFEDIFFVDNSEYLSNNIWINSNKKIPFLNDNEIILGKNIVETLNIKDPIGKKFEIFISKNDEEIKQEFTIIGINENINIRDIYYTYLNKNVSLNWSYDIAKIFSKGAYLENITLNGKPTPSFGSPKIHKVTPQNDNIKILEGRNIENYDEILIPSSDIYADKKYLNEYFNIGGIMKGFSVKVVGIYENDNDEIMISNDLYNIKNDNAFKSINVYTDDKSKIEELEKEGYRITNYINEAISKIVNEQNSTSFILAYISFALALLSLLFITVFSFMIIHSKRKIIGILKIYGAKPFQSLMYHISSIILLMVLTLVISLIIIQPIQFLLYSNMNSFTKITPIMSEVYFKMLITWMIIFGFTIFIYTSISISTFFKKSLLLLRG